MVLSHNYFSKISTIDETRHTCCQDSMKNPVLLFSRLWCTRWTKCNKMNQWWLTERIRPFNPLLRSTRTRLNWWLVWSEVDACLCFTVCCIFAISEPNPAETDRCFTLMETSPFTFFLSTHNLSSLYQQKQTGS